ncbi:hypothetical protein ACGFZS_22075 [Streptomyces sp. NPDC048288]|uniref:hypothetical protein n=1 Tax=Streptomyces sp. NPDC048288 TaxID=3365529 RepID=UPI003718EFFF
MLGQTKQQRGLAAHFLQAAAALAWAFHAKATTGTLQAHLVRIPGHGEADTTDIREAWRNEGSLIQTDGCQPPNEERESGHDRSL